MYRFNNRSLVGNTKRVIFKYNKCIGSIPGIAPTSDQYVKFKYNKCIGSIWYKEHARQSKKRFKYNKCIGSIVQNVLDTRDRGDLNTTNVSVQSVRFC